MSRFVSAVGAVALLSSVACQQPQASAPAAPKRATFEQSVQCSHLADAFVKVRFQLPDAPLPPYTNHFNVSQDRCLVEVVFAKSATQTNLYYDVADKREVAATILDFTDGTLQDFKDGAIIVKLSERATFQTWLNTLMSD